MSDKSFGDHTNRNIVKNPLLSTAVTGLSIEDLTHNAVLLPAAPTQGLNTISDQQIGSQEQTLEHSRSEILLSSAGDANSNVVQTVQSTENFFELLDNRQAIKHETDRALLSVTQSKASVKTDDDFDVNEYFARLQGTRYVSAPLNSHLKEDQNANLETSEENLEEINLNEPDKAQQNEYQQSITADIAQNFSQLPTVLPQMASAVFSSFSNMLSMKSREPTPDGRSTGYQEVQFQMPEDTTVPLMGVDDIVTARDVAPPPREPPPTGGTISYRISTKKKYAQIPGLSTGDTAQKITYNSPNISHFTPIPDTKNEENIKYDSKNLANDHKIAEITSNTRKETFDLFNPVHDTYKETIEISANENHLKPFSVSKDNEANINPLVKPDIATQYNIPTPQSQSYATPTPQLNAAIIPPPPMFSNLTKKDESPTGKSILPPSVARRISAKHPIIKTNIPTASYLDNLLVPAPLPDVIMDSKTQLGTFEPSSPNHLLDPASASTVTPATNLHSSTIIPTHNPEPVSELNSVESLLNPLPIIPVASSESQDSTSIRIVLSTISKIPNISSTSSIEDANKSSKPSIYIPSTSESSILKHSHESTVPDLSIMSTYLTGSSSVPMMPISSLPLFSQPDYKGTLPAPPVPSNPTPQSSTNVESISFSQTNLPPPPMFFNISQAQSEALKADTKPINAPNLLSQNISETPKPLVEPPKITSHSNYRMTKKRPQYYSGPIEGIGAISNNVKPIIPSISNEERNTFQDSMFTPSQVPISVKPAVDSCPPANIDQASTPFDINAQVKNTEYSQELFKPQEYSQQAAYYDTAFDFSRQTTESYEQPRQESSGFGIIGSLKSKLSSLDINKIQSTVTTFFDPSYNLNQNESTSNDKPNKYDAFSNVQTQSNFEILVPNIQDQSTGQYNLGQDTAYVYPQTNQYYQAEQPYYYQNQEYIPGSSYYSDVYNAPTQTFTGTTALVFEPQVSSSKINDVGDDFVHSVQNTDVQQDANKAPVLISATTIENVVQHDPFLPGNNLNDQKYLPSLPPQTTSEIQPTVQITPEVHDESNNIFSAANTSLPSLNEDIQDSLFSYNHFTVNPSVEMHQSNLLHKQNTTSNTRQLFNQGFDLIKDEDQIFVPDELKKVSKNVQSFAKTITASEFIEKSITPAVKEISLLESLSKDEIPFVAVSSVPLFGLSTLIAERYLDEQLEDDDKNNCTSEIVNDDIFESNTNDSLFENIRSIPVDDLCEDDDNSPAFNICETCREIKPEHREGAEDFTSQLIENITSPIQLLNPVEVPLTEESALKADITDTEFDKNQCAEIFHITEETISALNVQAAAEMLDKVEDDIKIDNYGWQTDNSDLHVRKARVDHNYSHDLNTNAVGLFEKSSLFYVPTNASDETKAEFVNSQEETMISSQMSLPSAPPAEEDLKSEAIGGLDVHSIEQDAKEDYQFFEEYIIEPSETDDDKIECIEREKSSEECSQDTFTNRVEKYKQKEDEEVRVVQRVEQIFDLPVKTSPAISIASYFDTGNYAAETHYRNSISSPSSSNINAGIQNISMRIPPGFEDEYNRRLSDVSATLSFRDKDEYVPVIPETSTQTRTITTTTFTTAEYSKPKNTSVISPNLSDIIPEHLPTEILQSKIPLMSIDSDEIKVENQEPDEFIVTRDQETKIPNEKNIMPEPLNLFSSLPEKRESLQSYPDPINFFSSNEPSISSNPPDNSFNRLASYFSTPKPDHSKSFFELSQSQNHYRHETININEFDSSVSQNIPRDVYLANLTLVKDLTSPHNITVTKEQVIRTVNYFTVEYDDVKTDFNKGEPEIKKAVDLKANVSEETLTLDDTIKSCKYCCNISNNYNYKTTSDSSEKGKESGPNMEAERNNGRRSYTVNFDGVSIGEDTNDGATVTNENRSSTEYAMVKYHWFYRVDVEEKSIWRGFSVTDSRAIEEAFNSPDLQESTVVPTDGGRYDVNVMGRLRIPVYWNDMPTNVLRCSWFYKGTTDARYVPYAEDVAEKLEEEYRHGVTTGEWHRRLILPNSELVIMHGPTVMVHFLYSGNDAFSTPPQSTSRPRVVRRGCDEAEVEDPEPSSIDHLLMMVHGVGSACDMRFRSVEQVVEDFRATSLQLVQSHYKNSYDSGIVNRVEVLPVSWHARLHAGAAGVDGRLARVTLASIPRVRSFTNDTVLDVLLYTSPVYCQTIIDTVCSEINRIYNLFKARNPNFTGGISLGGHSLGSVILYDLLCHQMPKVPTDGESSKSYVSGEAGTGQPTVRYPALDFSPAALYALGSPIAIFECIRGVDMLGSQFSLPTCAHFFNIFHPYDPIAYRIEPLINAELRDVKPSLIPHHKGRKRMHLELKDTMARVGADLKQKLMESLRTTWNKWKAQPPPTDGQLEKVVEEEMEKQQMCDDLKDDTLANDLVTPEMLGRLNSGRRIDYVLQEAPLEMINEYLFAMSSHVGYWESEDTMLLILREIYDSLGVQPDSTVPQQNMTVQRTRITKQDETIFMGNSEHPSTSQGRI